MEATLAKYAQYKKMDWNIGTAMLSLIEDGKDFSYEYSQ